jgi:hypothetical protein
MQHTFPAFFGSAASPPLTTNPSTSSVRSRSGLLLLLLLSMESGVKVWSERLRKALGDEVVWADAELGGDGIDMEAPSSRVSSSAWAAEPGLRAIMLSRVFAPDATRTPATWAAVFRGR